MFEVNYLSILVASVAAMAVGALWYSPVLFGNMWIKLMGFTPEQLEEMKGKGMAKSYLVMFVSLFVMGFVLNHVLLAFEAETFLQGLEGGFWMWLGFVATLSLGSILWEGKSLKLYVINVLHSLVAIALMGGILALWV